jgi:ornithine cyclodeaminase/alanine dehydrogenase-like protein (mu-crystallin family)
MLILEYEQVFEKLPMRACIEVVRDAIVSLSTGKSNQPLRMIAPLPDGNLFGFMPAWMGADDYFGAKIATVFHTNAGTAYPTHMGYVMLLESAHGSVCALADASAITQVRTGAVSALATGLLARRDARSLALIGAGAQARSHLEGMLCVRDITEVTVYDQDAGRAEAFARDMSPRFKVPVRVCADVSSAARDADIICTVTNCKTPILTASMVKAGAHINAVGAYTKTTREIATDLVVRSRLYADAMESILKEGGEFLIPRSEGVLDESHILGDLGGLLQGKATGRTDNSQVTLFDAHGLAVEDVACARYLYLKETGRL